MQPADAPQPSMQPIAVVGRGRVGGSLARALRAAGIEVSLAGREGPAPATEVAILCVPDGEIESACEQAIARAPGIRFVAHTSGATMLSALALATSRGAAAFSLHPLQTVPDPEADLAGSPAAIAGTSPGAVDLAHRIARACRMVPFDVPEDSRAAYHAAAAIASNFLVTLESSAEELLAAAGVENGRELLTPLVLRSAENWARRGSGALTGPIARGDEATVARHLEAIAQSAPALEPMYLALAERTREMAAAGRTT